MSWMEQTGFEVRRLSHMKRAVKPKVSMKLVQQRQHPPPPPPEESAISRTGDERENLGFLL